jgi:hypothetical protein
MAPAPVEAERPANPFFELVEALSNRQGQIDIRLEKMSLKLPFSGGAVELNGTVTVSVHLRELTERERAAHVSRQVKALSS